MNENSFDAWKAQLRESCEREGKHLAFEALTDDVLRLLWKQGLRPSVKAIIESDDAIK